MPTTPKKVERESPQWFELVDQLERVRAMTTKLEASLTKPTGPLYKRRAERALQQLKKAERHILAQLPTNPGRK